MNTSITHSESSGPTNLTFDQIMELVQKFFKNVSTYAYSEGALPNNSEGIDYPPLPPEIEKIRQDKLTYTELYNAKEAVAKQESNFQYYKFIRSFREEYGESPSYSDLEQKFLQKFFNLECEQVAEYGGEDMGSTWYRVFHYPVHNVYIRVNGGYGSHIGTEFYDGWGSCEEVTPKTRTVTYFE